MIAVINFIVGTYGYYVIMMPENHSVYVKVFLPKTIAVNDIITWG